jgi:hypothetical protein
MNQTLVEGPVALADSLVATLEQEYDALVDLHNRIDHQLEALRARDGEAMEMAAFEANQTTTLLSRLTQARERQMRLLGKLLHIDTEQVSLQRIADRLGSKAATSPAAERIRETRRQVLSQAAETQHHCEELDFALRYALRLGEEMLVVLRGLEAPPQNNIYTAKGNKAMSSSSISLVDRMG